jgi:hypothetical protein
VTAKPEYRVKIEYDDDPDFSWLKQWDTPEKYYGGAPKCSHGTVMEYRCGHTWESDHPTYGACCTNCNGDYGCNNDDCQCHLCTEFAEYDGKGNEFGGQVIDKRRRHGLGVGEHNFVPFDTYMATWGNPERHVHLGYTVERRDPPCNACGRTQWEPIDSLWGIDFMDWSFPDTGTFDLDEIKRNMMHGSDDEKYLFGEIWAAIKADIEKE